MVKEKEQQPKSDNVGYLVIIGDLKEILLLKQFVEGQETTLKVVDADRL